MNYIKVTNDKGASIVIDNINNYALIDITGLNPPKANINRTMIAGSDGSSVVNTYVQDRNIVMTLQLMGDIESNRLALYDIFKIKRSVTFLYSSDLIEAKIQGYVEAVEVPPMVWPVKALISLICPQPYFEALENIIADVASIVPQFQFPLELLSTGIEMGIINPSQAINVLNPGDIPIGMTITYRATGEVVNPKIINTHTLQFIELTTTMELGDVITISTETNKKRIQRIRDGVVSNLFNALVIGSTFLQLSEGDNVLYVSAASGSSALLADVQYIPKYSGV